MKKEMFKKFPSLICSIVCRNYEKFSLLQIAFRIILHFWIFKSTFEPLIANFLSTAKKLPILWRMKKIRVEFMMKKRWKENVVRKLKEKGENISIWKGSKTEILSSCTGVKGPTEFLIHLQLVFFFISSLKGFFIFV